ncbi:hypothetical protein OKW30_004661 [Paraburkholderia sp. Clong3]|uniref:hypothetical protein n=1 Tax=Paraburkholderia sp. Clong3 TaxID=2991061 RepID=UPI003D1AE432
MSSIAVYQGSLPGVTVEQGELVWESHERDGKQVLATIVARRFCCEVDVVLTTDEYSTKRTAAVLNSCDSPEEERIDQLLNSPISVSSCFTSVMGLLTEAFEAQKSGEAFLFGSLEQWSFALSQLLPKVFPWHGPVRISPAHVKTLVAELDAHLHSA